MTKALLFIFTIVLADSVMAQNDPTAVWIFRMEQEAKESFLFRKFQTNNEGFPSSAGLLSKNDTIKYNSGQLFRTCEVSDNKLNGQYKIYYPSGIIYMISLYKNNVLTDSTICYDEKGKIESVIKYISTTQTRQIYFDSNLKRKRIDNIETSPGSNVTFESGYVHSNNESSVNTEYYNPEGLRITKKEYFKLYPEEKE